MTSDKKLPVIMDREEVAALKAQANTRCPTGLRDRAIMQLMHKGGLRVSEVCKLRRRDIQWSALTVIIRDGKGGKDRPVPVGETTVAWLKAWDALRPRGEFFFNRVRKTKRHPAGAPLSARAIQLMVKHRAAKAGLDQITPHTFRHTFGCELREEGVEMRIIQTLLGHADVRTTQHYTQLRPTEAAEVIRRRDHDEDGPDPDVLP